MLKPTQTEIAAGVDKFASDPSSSPNLKAVAVRRQKNSITKINAVLGQSDSSVTTKEIGMLISWLRGNWETLTTGQKTSTRDRLSNLRSSNTADENVKRYLTQALRRFANLGDDDDTILKRLKVVLDGDAANVDADEFQQLLERADAFFNPSPASS